MLTQDLAQQVVDLSPNDIPEKAVAIAQLALLDWYAVSVAGLDVDPLPKLERYVSHQGAAERARLVGSHTSSSPDLAALYNGTAGHVLDYDDVHNAVPGHVTINIAPAVFALAEDIGATGSEVLTAFVAGFEQMCRIGLGFHGKLFVRGWQGTTIGAISAAAAAAKLLKLDVDGTQMAMALAVSQAGGVHGNYGSMSKCLNVGLAAQAGVRAALWAADGITGSPGILERQKGFIDVYSDSFDKRAAFEEPEGGWHLYRNLFKLHASCFLTHATLQAWASLAHEHKLGLSNISKVTVTIEEERHRIVLTEAPKDGLQAKFNLRFCLAMAMSGIDTSDPSAFSTATTARQDIQELAESIEIKIDPSVSFETAKLDVTLRDGRKLSGYADAGEPEADLSLLSQAVEAKAKRLLSSLPDGESARLIANYRNIRSLPDINALHPYAEPATDQGKKHG